MLEKAPEDTKRPLKKLEGKQTVQLRLLCTPKPELWKIGLEK
jgi:hypothetical protein